MVLLFCLVILFALSFQETKTGKISVTKSEDRIYFNEAGLKVFRIDVEPGEIVNIGEIVEP